MDFQNFIKSELLILVPVMYLVGIGLKKSKLPDTYIPITLGAISVVLSAFWIIATTAIIDIRDVALAIFMAVTQGVLAAGASVYANQIYVQSRKEE